MGPSVGDTVAVTKGSDISALLRQGKELEAGRLLHENMPPTRRPAWAARVLRAVLSVGMEMPPQVGTILDVAGDEARWIDGHGVFDAMRDHFLSTFGQTEQEDRPDYWMYRLAEIVAKVTYNASGGDAPFDYHAGYRVPVFALKAARLLGPGVVERVERAICEW